jgi:hypothetical protein
MYVGGKNPPPQSWEGFFCSNFLYYFMEKKFLIRCRNCKWYEFSTGLSSDLEHLHEIKKGCVNCGGPRKFRCPKCGMSALMHRVNIRK